MKTKIFVLAFMLLNLVSAYCSGAMDMELVNAQEINLDQIDTIEVRYRSERISLFKSDTDSFILKEYMNKDDSKYYAKITSGGNKLVVEAGQRPFSFGNRFKRRIEVYVPASDRISISIGTNSGKIEANSEYTASSMTLETSSGNISVNSINGDVFAETSSGEINLKKISGTLIAKSSSGNIHSGNVGGDADIHTQSGEVVFDKIRGQALIETSSGNILVNSIDGDVSAETSSGRISLGLVNGKTDLKASSGRINCVVSENAGDISITTSSGSVILDIARNFIFNFSARTRSGSLHTPFSDKLYRSLSNEDFVQGVINGDNISETQKIRNISINTRSGSIRLNWK